MVTTGEMQTGEMKTETVTTGEPAALTIRTPRPDEGGTLADIESRCFSAATAASRGQIEARLAAFPDCFLLAEADGVPVGFINGARADEPALPDAMYHDTALHRPGGAWQTVFGLSVLPPYRRRSVAGRLLEAFIELARKRGCDGVVLTCREPLIHYYERFGFVDRGVADSAHGGEIWYDMRLTF